MGAGDGGGGLGEGGGRAAGGGGGVELVVVVQTLAKLETCRWRVALGVTRWRIASKQEPSS